MILTKAQAREVYACAVARTSKRTFVEFSFCETGDTVTIDHRGIHVLAAIESEFFNDPDMFKQVYALE
jgi:hypothetical protein